VSTDLSWPQAPPPITIPPVTPSADIPPVTPAADEPRYAPPVAATAYAVLARLSTGDRIEVAAHDDEPAARAEATALMRYLRDGRGDWPYLDGRFVRPDAIVSIDIDETRA
jgi:hypothetical protein